MFRAVFFIFFCCLAIPTFAADLFTIDDIKVTNTGQSAKEAKDGALLIGQRQAFTQLVERLSDKNTNVPTIDDSQLSDIIQGVEVYNEKITPTYYKATFSISFNKAMVVKILKDNNIHFVDKKSAPIVIIPVYIDENGKKLLFESENLLRGAFIKVTNLNHVLDVVIPNNITNLDIQKINSDIENISPETKNILTDAMQKYNADKFILLIATKAAGENTINIRMQNLKDSNVNIREATFKPEDNEDIFEYSAGNILKMLEIDWSRDREENAANSQKIKLNIVVSGLEDWVVINKRLQDMHFIQITNINDITIRYVSLDVVFRSDIENFRTQLKEYGFDLRLESDKYMLYKDNSF